MQVPEWLINIVLGVACGRLGSFPGWKLMYRAQRNVAEREGWSHLMPRHYPGFSGIAWVSTALGGGVAILTGVPWWSLLCGTLLGAALAGITWARHWIAPGGIDDDPLEAASVAGAEPDQ